MKSGIFFISHFLLITFTSFAQNALHFNRTGEYVQTNFPGVLGSNDRTFEAWIKIDTSAPAATMCILDYGSGPSGSRNTFIVTGDLKLSFISGGTNGNFSSDSTNVIPKGQWTHVAFVLQSGIGCLFVNGDTVGTGNLSGVNTPSSGTDLRMGQRIPGGSTLLKGAIDEVRIWNVARTQQEIEADMNNEFCIMPTGLVAYYSFNQGIAGGSNIGVDTLFDLVVGNNGVLNNFILQGDTSNWVSGISLFSDLLTNETAMTCDSFVSPSGKFTWSTPGIHFDTLPTRYGCDSVIEVDLTVVDIITTVSLNGSTLSSNEPSGSYLWLDCENNYQPISGGSTKSLNITANGSYAVRIDKLGCVDTTSCTEINWVGLDEISKDSFKLYPNPSSGEIFIENTEAGKLSIIDYRGVLVYETSIENGSLVNVSLPTSIDNGSYLIYIQSDQIILRRNLIIQR